MVFDPTKKIVKEETKPGGKVFDPTVSASPSPAMSPPQTAAGDQPPASGQERLLATMVEQPGVERVKTAVGNIPGSAKDFAGVMYDAITSPVQTAKGLGRIVAGGAQKLVPGEQEYEKDFGAMTQHFADRYGDMPQFQQTLMDDPVGTLADVASVLFGSGMALRGVGAGARVPAISAAGKSMGTAGAVLDPVNIAANAAVKGVKAATPAGLPAQLYESAAKFSTTIPQAERVKMAGLAVDEGILPTQGGIDKTRGLIGGLNDEITRVIDNATQTGQKIDIDGLFKYLDDVRKDAILTGTPLDNLRAIDRIEGQIRAMNQKLGRQDMTPQEVQRLKQNIYKDVNYASTKEKVRYKEEAQKAIARAAKEEIELLHPEIKGMNAREGELINLLKSLEKSASRISNRDIIGIGVPLKTGVGHAAGGVPGMVAGLVSGLLDTPLVKARLAVALRKAQRGKGSVPGAEARAVTYQAGRAQEEGAIGGGQTGGLLGTRK